VRNHSCEDCAGFWKRVNKTNECWLWTGALTGGYGRFRRTSAHRWILSHIDGRSMPRMDACHKCHNRACVRPAHLRWGTRSENMMDASAIGRLGKFEKSKTHCPKGHEYGGVRSNGERRCLTCKRASEKRQEYRDRKNLLRRQARLAARPAPTECTCDLRNGMHRTDCNVFSARADPRPAPPCDCGFPWGGGLTAPKRHANDCATRAEPPAPRSCGCAGAGNDPHAWGCLDPAAKRGGGA